MFSLFSRLCGSLDKHYLSSLETTALLCWVAHLHGSMIIKLISQVFLVQTPGKPGFILSYYFFES